MASSSAASTGTFPFNVKMWFEIKSGLATNPAAVSEPPTQNINVAVKYVLLDKTDEQQSLLFVPSPGFPCRGVFLVFLLSTHIKYDVW